MISSEFFCNINHTTMKTLQISKNRSRDYLAEKLARNIIDSQLEDLITVLRYNSLGGYERLDDFDLFENLVAAMPELELVFLVETDEHYLHVAVKPDYRNEEDAILVDVRKVIQVIV
jgi:hypothetical protein